METIFSAFGLEISCLQFLFPKKKLYLLFN